MPSSVRPTRTSRGYLLRALLVVPILCIVGWIAAQMLPKQSPRVVVPPPDLAHVPVEQFGGPIDVAAQYERIQTSAAVQTTAKNSVCEIIGSGPEGNRVLGAGVFVDQPVPGVLTCLHVVSQTTEPAVRLSGGGVVNVTQCRRVDPALDLVYLIVEEHHGSSAIQWQSVAADGKPIVAAVGHPEGSTYTLSPGQILGSQETNELAADEQEFVARLTSGATRDNVTWLVHSAPLQQGHSGGPLLDIQGQAVGLNIWVNETAKRSFALPASEVQAFLSADADEGIPPEQLASPEARRRAKLWQMSGEQLKKVFELAKAMRWQPASQEDYQILQQLAFGLNIARDDDLLRATGRVAEHVEDLAKASQPVMLALGKERWRDAGQLLFINEFASLAVNEVETGFFAFVRVEEVLVSNEDEQLVLVNLSGFEVQLAVILDRGLREPKPGEQWVLLGVQQRERRKVAGQPVPTVISRVVLLMGDSR